MEICVLNPLFHPYNGGTEKVLFEIYKRMAKKHNITVISATLRSGDKESVEEIEGITVRRLKATYIELPKMPMPFIIMNGMRKAVAKADADIYHINNRYQFFKDTLLLIKKKRKKIALTIHNALPRNIDKFTDNAGLFYDLVVGRDIMHSADLITGVSQNAIDTTVPRKERYKSYVVYNGVDYNNFRYRSHSNQKVSTIRDFLELDGDIVLTNGRLVTQKGQIYLLKAVEHLVNRKGMDLSMLVIGKGKLETELHAEAARHNMDHRFKIVSNIHERLLPYYYNVASVFSMPSLYEPASMALLEGLSCQLPTIATRIGGIPEMMKNTGYYVQPKSVDGLANRIESIMGNRKRAERMAREARALMVKEHDWNRIVRRYEELFLGLL